MMVSAATFGHRLTTSRIPPIGRLEPVEPRRLSVQQIIRCRQRR
jgi:hypothetical protein